MEGGFEFAPPGKTAYRFTNSEAAFQVAEPSQTSSHNLLDTAAATTKKTFQPRPHSSRPVSGGRVMRRNSRAWMVRQPSDSSAPSKALKTTLTVGIRVSVRIRSHSEKVSVESDLMHQSYSPVVSPCVTAHGKGGGWAAMLAVLRAKYAPGTAMAKVSRDWGVMLEVGDRSGLGLRV